jgi:hypothetical protein
MKRKRCSLIDLLKQFDNEEIIVNIKEHFLSIEEINKNLKYNVSYKEDKFFVDITKNDIFSYLDTERELLFKMKKYIKTEQYEKAIVLKKYMDTIEIYYF